MREALRTVQEERDIAQYKEEKSRSRVGLSKGKTAALLVKRAEMLVCCISSQVESPGICGKRALMKSEASPWDFEAMDIGNEKLASQPEKKRSTTQVLESKKHLQYMEQNNHLS